MWVPAELRQEGHPESRHFRHATNCSPHIVLSAEPLLSTDILFTAFHIVSERKRLDQEALSDRKTNGNTPGKSDALRKVERRRGDNAAERRAALSPERRPERRLEETELSGIGSFNRTDMAPMLPTPQNMPSTPLSGCSSSARLRNMSFFESVKPVAFPS